MGEDLAEVFPYQLVEPRPRRVARPATVFGDDLGVPPAHVVAAAVPAGAGVGALPASPAAEEGPQEVAVALVVARGEPLDLLLWESFSWTRSKVSRSTISGTGMPIHSSSGRRLAVRPAPRAQAAISCSSPAPGRCSGRRRRLRRRGS